MFKDPVFISLFLLVFAVLWVLICGVLSLTTGWHQFSKKHPFSPTHRPVEQFNFSSIQFNQIGSYSYGILISIYQEGIGIQPLLLFKAFHKPYLIRWEEVSEIKEEKEFFWYKALDVYVENTKIRFYGKAIPSIIRACDLHSNRITN